MFVWLENVALHRYYQRGFLESMSHILQYRLIFLETHTGYILPWSVFNPTYQVGLIYVIKNERTFLAVGLITDSQCCKPWPVYWYTLKYY